LAESVVQANLLEPLQKKEEDRSRFSRAVSPPRARRIRILDEDPRMDGDNRAFLSFAVDESRALGAVEDREDGWFRDAIVGCVYPGTGEVLVKRGEVYYASSILWGKPTPVAPAGVCRTR
jgi:hypothetical protein